MTEHTFSMYTEQGGPPDTEPNNNYTVHGIRISWTTVRISKQQVKNEDIAYSNWKNYLKFSASA